MKLAELINKGKNACCIFFDISKACDKVWHFCLIYKPINHGIEKYMIKYILNFLPYRIFIIKINEVEDVRFPNKCGVP